MKRFLILTGLLLATLALLSGSVRAAQPTPEATFAVDRLSRFAAGSDRATGR